MSKRAVILAGGKGTRLHPYTVVLPKPLMPVGDYPILEVIVRQLAYFGFSHITMAVNHQADIIKAFFGNGDRWRVKIDYSLETNPLSTMGPLRLIQDLPDNFLVMNGDILTTLDFNRFFRCHVEQENMFTISAYQRDVHSEYGVLEVNEEGWLTGFQEKPVVKYDVSMGIYMVRRDVLQYIPEGQPYGFDDLMIEISKHNNSVAVKKFKGYWLDIGRAEDYRQAIDEFEKLKGMFLR